MKVLVLNCGSSSLKCQVIDVNGQAASGRDDGKVARALVDGIGGKARLNFEVLGAQTAREDAAVANHAEAVERVLRWLAGTTERGRFDAVGHRVVHGGDRFATPVTITAEVISFLDELTPLAPLHNPPSLDGIRAARSVLGNAVPMVAVFDTSFHRTLPAEAFTYAIPFELAQRHKIRRYGFHGLAHHYAALRYSEITRKPLDKLELVTLHLGNGCSASAIRAGKSVDTSMGFTPLEGLVMGTRSGDLDPAVVPYLTRQERVEAPEVENWLNQRSGLLGVSGLSHDMRELVRRSEEPRARLAIDVFCYRARKYLGAYLAVLGGAQSIIFSGGIGENNPVIREKICRGMERLGVRIDRRRNAAAVGREARISTAAARIGVYVIPSDEEALIARETARLVQS